MKIKKKEKKRKKISIIPDNDWFMFLFQLCIGPTPAVWVSTHPCDIMFMFTIIEIEPIPGDSVGKYRAEGVEWAI